MSGEEGKYFVSWRVLLLCAPPLAFLLLGDALAAHFSWAGTVGLRLTTNDIIHVARHDAVGRLLIMAALAATSGAAFLAVLMFANDVRRLFKGPTRQALLIGVAASLLIGTVYGICSGAGERIPNYLGTSFVLSTTSLLSKIETESNAPGNATQSPASAQPPKSDLSNPVFDKFNTVVLSSWAILSLGAAAVIFGGVSSLAELTGDPTVEQRRAALIFQRNRLRTYINLAAALMVTTILFLLAWTRWPLYLLGGRQAADYAAHVDTLSLYYGIVYSLVILSFAAPVSAVLHERWTDLPSPPPLPDGTLPAEAQVFDTRFLGSLGKILAVFAPALASSLPAILDLLP